MTCGEVQSIFCFLFLFCINCFSCEDDASNSDHFIHHNKICVGYSNLFFSQYHQHI